MNEKEQIALFAEESIAGSDCFLVDFKVKPTNNYKIYMDSDTGFTLEKSIRVNRFIRRKIEEAGLYPEGDFSLEVSSPGIDTPLTMKRQYMKNIGRKLEIVLKDEHEKGITGRLSAVEEDRIEVETTEAQKNKKEVTVAKRLISFDEIESAVVCIEF